MSNNGGGKASRAKGLVRNAQAQSGSQLIIDRLVSIRHYKQSRRLHGGSLVCRPFLRCIQNIELCDQSLRHFLVIVQGIRQRLLSL